MTFDYCVIGGGIVGLATAMGLLKKRPGSSLLVLEKELNSFQHQTGRNSGVIHSGIYYPPGSLKADLCRRGALATMNFCGEHAIPFEVCGKLLVATNSLESERMNSLFERARASGIAVEKLGTEELKRREPNIVGLGALFVSSTGVVDYKSVAGKMGDVVRSKGGEIKFGVKVNSIQEFPSEHQKGSFRKTFQVYSNAGGSRAEPPAHFLRLLTSTPVFLLKYRGSLGLQNQHLP